MLKHTRFFSKFVNNFIDEIFGNFFQQNLKISIACEYPIVSAMKHLGSLTFFENHNFNYFHISKIHTQFQKHTECTHIWDIYT